MVLLKWGDVGEGVSFRALYTFTRRAGFPRDNSRGMKCTVWGRGLFAPGEAFPHWSARRFQAQTADINIRTKLRAPRRRTRKNLNQKIKKKNQTKRNVKVYPLDCRSLTRNSQLAKGWEEKKHSPSVTRVPAQTKEETGLAMLNHPPAPGTSRLA